MTFFLPICFLKMAPWPLCVLFLQFEENRSETRSYSPAASQHSDCQFSRYQVQLCPPTCLTCRDPCQAEPEFTQMWTHTDPENTGITSHMWWNGGNHFCSLHCSHPKGQLWWTCWVIYIRNSLTAFINLKIEPSFCFLLQKRNRLLALAN